MILYPRIYLIILVVLLLPLVQCSKVSKEQKIILQHQRDMDNWLGIYKKHAVNKLGISQNKVDELFQDTKYNPIIHKTDSRQAEFHLNLERYFKIVLPEETYVLAKEFLNTHWDELTVVEQKYNIPISLIVAFIGIETRYGTKGPTFNAYEAIANLAYNPRRRTFFTNELDCLLRLYKVGNVDKNVKSSWAGALGYPQFMPSTYLAYGLDGNKDGKIDLSNSLQDVFASVANYLRNLGWNYYRDWGYQVTLPKNFDYSLVVNSINGNHFRQPIYKWVASGVKIQKPTPSINYNASARIITENVDDKITNAYLVTSNFDAILKWNRSNLFALAVTHLSDSLQDIVIAKKKEAVKSADINKANQGQKPLNIKSKAKPKLQPKVQSSKNPTQKKTNQKATTAKSNKKVARSSK